MAGIRRHAVLAVLASVAALPLAAQDIDCDNAQTQLEMNQCAEQDWQAADAALNDAYAGAKAVLQDIDDGLPKADQGAVRLLRDGQRAWISFRDATCAAEGYAMHGGSAEPLLVYGCLARLTEQRTTDLQALAEGY